MGDVRYERAYRQVQDAADRAGAIAALSDEALVAAVAGAREDDPYLANVLASEAMNRARRKEAILTTAGEGLLALDRAGRVLYANPAAERKLGWPRGAFLGKDFHDMAHAADASGARVPRELCPVHRRTLARGEVVTNENEAYVGMDGQAFPVAYTAAPVLRDSEVEGAVIVFRDITERKLAEAERARLFALERRARVAAETAARRSRFLAEAGALLSASLDYRATLEQLAQLAILGHADWCVVHVRERDDIRPVAVAHADPEKVELVREVQRRFPIRVGDPEGVARVLRTGEPQVYERIDDALLVETAHDEAHLDLLRRVHPHAAMLVPLEAHGHTLGVLSLVSAESGRTFDEEDLELARDLGRRAGLAIENARLFAEAQREVERRRRREAQTAAIAELGQDALEGMPEQALMDKAVGMLARLLDLEHAKVLQLLPGGKELLMRSGVGWHVGLVGAARVPAHASSQAGYTLLSAAPVVASDLREEPRFRGHQILHDHNILSGITVVIGAPRPGPAWGVLGVHATTPRKFSEDDVHVVQSIANVLASAVERRAAEDALRGSESRYRTLYDESPMIYLTVDHRGCIARVNRYGAEYLGYTVEELLGMRSWDLFVPEEREEARESHARFFADPPRDGPREWWGHKLRKDGSAFAVREVAAPVVGSDGVLRMLVACVDMTRPPPRDPRDAPLSGRSAV